MVAQDQGRVLWIDFDSAQTFSDREPGLKKKMRLWTISSKLWYVLTDLCVAALIDKAQAQDYEEGELRRAYSYYYEWFAEL